MYKLAGVPGAARDKMKRGMVVLRGYSLAALGRDSLAALGKDSLASLGGCSLRSQVTSLRSEWSDMTK